MDRLSVIGLEIWTRVGCSKEERAFPQRLDLDVDLFLPLEPAGRRDDIKRTVDYAALAARLKKELERETFRLAETVAERAAAIALSFSLVHSAEVRVRKRALPGIAHAEVALTRARSSSPRGEM
jgi:FolB domain-containing protein